MANIGTFQPVGQTYSITAGVTPPTPIQISFQVIGSGAFRVTNIGSYPVFLGFGSDATTATANAAIPTTGTPTNTAPLLPTATEVFNPACGSNVWVTASTASGTSTIYITPGEGM